MTKIENIIKRFIDIISSSILIIILSPLLLFTAIKIYLDDKGNPIYTQIRIGRNQKEFTFFKFRSMVTDADKIMREDKNLYKQLRSGNNKIINDPRITPFGKLIRKYSIDELPQLLNIFKGDMSLVGPRPLRPDEFDMYYNESEYYKENLRQIVSVKPGITGIWQISGRSKISFYKRVGMESEYAKNGKIINDLGIIFKTPIAILKGDGAY